MALCHEALYGIKSINPPKASDIKLINSWLKMSFCIVILIPF